MFTLAQVQARLTRGQASCVRHTSYLTDTHPPVKHTHLQVQGRHDHGQADDRQARQAGALLLLLLFLGFIRHSLRINDGTVQQLSCVCTRSVSLLCNCWLGFFLLHSCAHTHVRIRVVSPLCHCRIGPALTRTCAHTYAHTRTHARTHTHTHTNTHTHTQTHTRTHIHTRARTHTHTHAHTHTRKHNHTTTQIQTHAHAHAHALTHSHAHTYTHAHAHAQKEAREAWNTNVDRFSKLDDQGHRVFEGNRYQIYLSTAKICLTFHSCELSFSETPTSSSELGVVPGENKPKPKPKPDRAHLSICSAKMQ
jgi:hypothetical protein